MCVFFKPENMRRDGNVDDRVLRLACILPMRQDTVDARVSVHLASPTLILLLSLPCSFYSPIFALHPLVRDLFPLLKSLSVIHINHWHLRLFHNHASERIRSKSVLSTPGNFRRLSSVGKRREEKELRLTVFAYNPRCGFEWQALSSNEDCQGLSADAG